MTASLAGYQYIAYIFARHNVLARSPRGFYSCANLVRFHEKHRFGTNVLFIILYFHGLLR